MGFCYFFCQFVTFLMLFAILSARNMLYKQPQKGFVTFSYSVRWQFVTFCYSIRWPRPLLHLQMRNSICLKHLPPQQQPPPGQPATACRTSRRRRHNRTRARSQIIKILKVFIIFFLKLFKIF